METTPLRRVRIEGLHRQSTLDIRLNPGLNILYGRNGTGKTTFLHVLANLADRDLARFAHVRFSKIHVETYSGDFVDLTQDVEDAAILVSINGGQISRVKRGDETPENLRLALQEILGGRPVYLPAFRSVLEAISRRSRYYRHEGVPEKEFESIVRQEYGGDRSGRDRSRPPSYYREAAQQVAHKTVLCREWFGPFVPVVRFPSLWEVGEELSDEYQQARFAVASTDRQAFSEVFVRVLKAAIGRHPEEEPADVPRTLSRIRKHLAELQEGFAEVPTVYAEIASLVGEPGEGLSTEETIAKRILRVYEDALAERIRAQEEAFSSIGAFEESINRFLGDKSLTVRMDLSHIGSVRPRLRSQMVLLPGGRRSGLGVLSSGERHVLTLLFSATHMSKADGILLIDEPELSLHVAWQRIILDELMKQAGGDRQVIAATHAPEVAAHHRELMVELAPIPWEGRAPDEQVDLLEDAPLLD